MLYYYRRWRSVKVNDEIGDATSNDADYDDNDDNDDGDDDDDDDDVGDAGDAGDADDGSGDGIHPLTRSHCHEMYEWVVSELMREGHSLGHSFIPSFVHSLLIHTFPRSYI